MRLITDQRLRNKTKVFENRAQAGEVLAEALTGHAETGSAVLAIPLGGIPVATKVASAIDGELDLVPAARLPLPDKPLVGFGAVTLNGEVYLNEEFVQHIDLERRVIDRVIEEEGRKLTARFRLLGPRPRIPLQDRGVVIVDDGLSTGYTMRAAVMSVRKFFPREIVVAVPTAAMRGVKRLEPEVATVVCPNLREGYFFSVLTAYRNWRALSEEVLEPFIQ